ncbi:hypothetical protein F7734_03845 [Scytonema sp. UIC 10036]|uniref:hypothetical protein n=1 Tax=Scytonema sp. UIC 10036 TaxID=2304196 RepID=UPI0012DA0DA8|nr:hypothetical protein [Scytonema sp. UIC 10036]MUG91662.1 hypothetical protein [Scytonema sp. UIC 10036]
MAIVKIAELQSVTQIEELSNQELTSVVGGLSVSGFSLSLYNLLFGGFTNDILAMIKGAQQNEPPEPAELPEPPEAPEAP